jgi:hypothetical protein
MKDKDFGKAIEALTKEIKQNPGNLNLYYWRGYGYAKTEQYDLAIKDFRALVDRAPRVAAGFGSLGWSLILAGRIPEAKEPSLRAHRLDPTQLAWTLNAGHSFLFSNDVVHAREYYKKAMRQMRTSKGYEDIIDDFDMFIKKGWNADLCRQELEWIKNELRLDTIASNSLLPIIKNDEYGFIDRDGRVVVRPQYREVGRFHGGLARVQGYDPKSNSYKYGFIDTRGNIVIPLIHETVGEFSNGLAMISGQVPPEVSWQDIFPRTRRPLRELEEHHYYRPGNINFGFIDKNGDTLVKPVFSHATHFRYGMSVVSMDNGHEGSPFYGAINTAGVFVIDPIYHAVGLTRGRFVVVTLDHGEQKVSVMKVNEDTLKEASVALANLREEDVESSDTASFLIPFESGGISGFIDQNGAVAISPKFSRASDFSDSLAAVQLGSGKWGYIDIAGSYRIEAQFDFVGSFKEGLAAVTKGAGWGYIDRQGTWKIKPQYTSASSFSGGLAWVVSKERGILIIDHNGKVLPIAIDNPKVTSGKTAGGLNKLDRSQQTILEAKGFAFGVAAIKVGTHWGLVDTLGRVLVVPQFDEIGEFDGGLARVFIDKKMGYIDLKGKSIWEPTR